MLRTTARVDMTGGGNGPFPRRRASRAVAAPTTHQSGIGVSSFTSISFSARVSSVTASARNKAGSDGLVIAGSPVTMPPGSANRARPARTEDMPSIETRGSWAIALTVLAVMSFAFGAPYITVVALKPIASELGSARTVPALGYSLAWFGSAVGGIAMGRIADRVGTRWTMAFGAAMIGVGLAIASTAHSPWLLWLGHGVFVGVLGIGGINAPGYVYVSRWFDRHRGTALALISSGQYVAGAVWPSIFERGIAQYGWRPTMLVFGLVVAGAVVPLALLVLRAPPETVQPM